MAPRAQRRPGGRRDCRQVAVVSTRSVVHVTAQLSQGGAGRALINLASALGVTGKLTQTVVSLRPATAPMLREAGQRDIPIASAPTAVELDRLVTDADIVQVHFWNSPSTWQF